MHPSAFLLAAIAIAGAAYVSRSRPQLIRSRRALQAGTVVFVVATAGPFDGWAEQAGLAVHVLQHLLVFSIAATLLVAGLRGRGLPAGVRAPMRGRTAAACLVGGAGLFWLLHSAPLLRLSITTPVANDVQHLLLLGAGVAVALPLAGSAALAGFAAAAYLVVTEIAIGALGIVLAWSPALLYPDLVFGQNPWGLSRETDQALAGAFILVLEEPLLAAEFAVVFIAGLAESDRRQRLEDEDDR